MKDDVTCMYIRPHFVVCSCRQKSKYTMHINLFFILQNGKKTTNQLSLFEVTLLFFPFCSTLPFEFLKQALDETSSSLAFPIFKLTFLSTPREKARIKMCSFPEGCFFFYVYVFFNCDRRKFLCTTEKKEINLGGFSPTF